MLRQFRTALVLFSILAVSTGLIYPGVVTLIGQVLFPYQANGSLITQNGKVIGSALLGQQWTDPKYFWGRPSATSGVPYNASASGGSNYSATNPALAKAVQQRIAELRAADPGNNQPVPSDLVTSSASGLDPDISVAAARYQAARVARARSLPLQTVLNLINQNTQGRYLGFIGEPRVNVLKLNLALDALK